MFSVAERDRVRARLLELAEDDPDVIAAAITGSYALGRSDEWSDVDLAFGIGGEVAPVLHRWTEMMQREFAAVHYKDLVSGSTIYRAFLLPDWLQVDLAFSPEGDFGPRGPKWRTIFGETTELATSDRSPDELVGRAWLFARHARVCIDRRNRWQAASCINTLRDNVLALACVRLGIPTRSASGPDMLPPEVTAPFEATLVHSLDDEELRRALGAANGLFAEELRRTDEELAETLGPMLEQLV